MLGLRWIMGLFTALFIVAGLVMIYQKNWAKKHPSAIQYAARADLDLVRRAEESFRGRYGTYTTDLGALAVQPKFTYYKVGFVQAAAGVGELNLPEPHRPEVMDFDALKAAKPKLK